MQIDSGTVYAWITAGVAAGLAGVERYRSNRATNSIAVKTAEVQEAETQKRVVSEILLQKDELIAIARQSAEQWKARQVEEHEEFKSYREHTHAQAQETQATILKQTEEIASLRTRTDMKPVLDTLHDIVEALGKILGRLDTIEGRK